MDDPRLVVLQDFFPEARALRAAFNRLVSDPYSQDASRDGVWNYWHVPGLYTYLRADPERVLPADALRRFQHRLHQFAFRRFGFSYLSGQTLSMYVDGCEQQLHNDAANGDYAFVYSLTNWDERRFEGGETLVFGGETTAVRGRAGTSLGFYDKVPARFNQLVLFDDRLLHGVARVTGGGMSPLDCRLVMHGHLSARDIVLHTRSAADGAAHETALQTFLPRLAELERKESARAQGFFTARMKIAPDGTVSRLRPLLFRVASHAGQALPRTELLGRLGALLARTRFPATAKGAEITIPISLVGKGLFDPSHGHAARRVLSTAAPGPRAKIRSRVPFIAQTEPADCGAATLAMILAHHGRAVPLAELREATGVSRLGRSSAKNMVAAARQHGLVSRARRVSLKELAACETPAILHWESDHFVVLDGWKHDGAVIVDPRTGPAFVTRSELAARFSGVVIELMEAPPCRARC